MKATLNSLRKRMPARQATEYDKLMSQRTNGNKPVALTSHHAAAISRTLKPGVTLEPMFDRVLVQYEEAQMKTAGGIIIPDRAQDRKHGQAYPAIVLKAGPGRWRRHEFDFGAGEDVRALLDILADCQDRDELGDDEVAIIDEIAERYGESVRKPMDYKAGDKVWAPCLNFPFYMDGKEVYLCNEDALLGLRQ